VGEGVDWLVANHTAIADLGVADWSLFLANPADTFTFPSSLPLTFQGAFFLPFA
jgi:hypothetical protein